MKRIFLLFGTLFLACSVWATGDLPTIIIHKSNGGPWAWLNLYNDILYTPSTGNGQPATLECSGAGYSSCRVQRNNGLTYYAPNITSNPTFSPVFIDAVNQIIETSERESSHGAMRGMQSKKIAITGNRGIETYVVKGSWQYNSCGDCTIQVYITSLDFRTR